MKSNPVFRSMDKDFWAHVRSLSQTLGYTDRATSGVNIPSFEKILRGMESLELSCDHLIQNKKPTPFAEKLMAYFEYRADVLNNTVQHQLMNATQAKEMYERVAALREYKIAASMNKQKGEKKQIAYLTAMVNMLIETHSQGIEYSHDPRQLTTITQNGKPLRTLSRRVDGAFPNVVNPVAIWEIKEYYHTTTFGSRVADGIYETLLDGMELEEMRKETGIHVEHVLMVDAHYTWWTCGRSYLCRMIDMLQMGYVDEILFGTEIEHRLPSMVADWVEKTHQRHR